MYNYNLQVGARGPYCRLNIHVPLVRLYFDDGDLRKDFRLSRPTLDSLVHRLQGAVDHGWGKALRCWCSCSEAFDIPRTTCHDVVHRVSKGI